MKENLSALVDRFADLEVAVVGEAMLDSYLEGATRRFCQEAPVPVVELVGRADLPGGAANTALNARRLGARVHLLSAVGDDAEGLLLRERLSEQGIATGALAAQPGRRTLHKQRIAAAGQLMLRLDQGSTEPIDARTEADLIARLPALFPRCDAIILSDFGYGVITPRVIRALAELQSDRATILVVDSRRLAMFRALVPTAVKPNYAEAAALVGVSQLQSFRTRAESIAAHGERILELTGARLAAVTLDSDGAVLLERGQPPYRTFAQPMRQATVVGAGDTFTAALALGLAAGACSAEAVELASAAAAIVVGKERTAPCSGAELREFVCEGGKCVGALDRFVTRLDYYRAQGRRIVFTNGCFDILHRGHITYLHRARMLGDILVVGVNSDRSIARLKGPRRPINTLEDRLQVLAALSCVDHLVPFDEDTPCNLVRAIRPDVFVKGGDYTRDRLPEADIVESYGGIVQILPLVHDRSTTGIIERIQATQHETAVALAEGAR